VSDMGKLTATQTCERLSNGNAIVFTRFVIPKFLRLSKFLRIRRLCGY